MRVFIWEYICSGAFSNRPLPDSLQREGRAMLSAVIADSLLVRGYHVTTTLDRRVSLAATSGIEAAEVEFVSDVEAEASAFDRLVKAADVTLVIAPETDGILDERVRRVLNFGGQTANCTPAAIKLCSDKLSLAQHFEARQLATIPTRLADLDVDDPWMWGNSPCVLKPRDGAGSWLTFYLPYGDVDAWLSARDQFRSEGMAERALLQPFISGTSLSVGCICHADGQVDVFPVGRQEIEGDRFQYRGGRLPAEIPKDDCSQIERLVRRACSTISGLSGYIGFDLILPEQDADSPVITEINPRLTTSYVGYRQLCDNNLASRLFESFRVGWAQTALQWKSKSIHFRADGTFSCETKFE